MIGLSFEILGSGTSQGVPVIGCDCPVCSSPNPKDNRLRSSALISYENTTVLIDCGPDFRQQMLRSDQKQVDAVLLTHEHMDHVSGLDDLRSVQFSANKPTKIYCTDRVAKRVKEQFAYAFGEQHYPGAPRFELIPILPGLPFELGNKRWIPIEGHHGEWPVLGFRVDELVYLTDVRSMDPIEIDKIRGAKILIVNALRIKPHYSHFHLDAAIAFAVETGVPTVYFTHISHSLGLHDEISLLLPKGMQLAYDGLKR